MIRSLAIGGALGLVLLACFLIAPVLAHDHERPGLTDWFKSLRNPRGVPCCDGSDARKLSEVDWKSSPDGKSYQVRVDGQWRDVPEEAVLDIPNKEGVTMVWIFNGLITCFLVGAGT